MDLKYEIILGDSQDIVSKLPSIVKWMGNYIHCVVTSPPYFQKREYGDNSTKEIGNEEDEETYISSLVSLFNSIPLHPMGSIWVNIGDKRNNGGLSMLPERFAIAMRGSGWVLADNVIWAKIVDHEDGSTTGSCMIEPAPGRLNGNGYENFYRFVKDPKNAWSDTCSVSIPRNNVDSKRYLPSVLMSTTTCIEGRSLHNVWQLPMGQTTKKHYAVYPLSLCERPIAMSCPMWVNADGSLVSRIVDMEEYEEASVLKRAVGKYNSISGPYSPSESFSTSGRADTGREYTPRKPVTKGWSSVDKSLCTPGIVLDPFCGTGTTGHVALKLGRNFIGIDLYDRFVQISKKRCKEAINLLSSYMLDPHEEAK